MMKRSVVLLLSIGLAFIAGADAPPTERLLPATRPSTMPATAPEIREHPPRDQVLILPLHVHVIRDKDRPDLDCRLTDDDLTRILGKVNKVWRYAGVQFVPTIHREPAYEPAEFDKQREKVARGGLGFYRMIANPQTRDLPGIHVYYVHELPPNGVYIGQNLCFVKETASLRKVEGGIDEPIPRVTSHEIGHALGLPHRQDRTNLMASGTTGTTFNEQEAKVARSIALKNKDVLTVAEAEARAKEATPEAASLRRLLDSME